MEKYNLVVVVDEKGEKLLMCRRSKNPYHGKLNFVGGKVEPGECDLDAAYRELMEETGIGRDCISLEHIMDFTYYIHESCMLQTYAGKLRGAVSLREEKHPLLWSDLSSSYDDNRYAGEGHILYIVTYLKARKPDLFI